jgi:uncharacterized membrane protein
MAVLAVYLPALAVAFVITLLELTEVVALVFALSADHSTVAHGASGAVLGVLVVALIALALGAALLAFPRPLLLWASAVTLAAFGGFLFRSTLRSFRRSRSKLADVTPTATPARAFTQFAGGFTVGAIEATEVVVVLLALAAAGYASSALVGAVGGGILLVVVTLFVRDRVRAIRQEWLKWGATSMLFTFAIFWAGTALGLTWPGGDLILVPLFLGSLIVVRGAIELALRRGPRVSVPM